MKMAIMYFIKDCIYREMLEMRDDSQSSKTHARMQYFLAV